MGTMRIITASKGMKTLTTIFAFFEIVIWLVAIGQIMQNLTNIFNYIAFAAGYTIGNYVGLYIEEKLSMGILMMRIITKKDAEQLLAFMKSAGYGFTRVNAEGIYGPVDVIFTIIKRKELKKVVDIIKHYNPNAIYTVEDIKSVSTPLFPVAHKTGSRFLPLFRFFPKRHPI
jgi:uncharacterized protein YebE (UPF0316 family)